MARECERAFYYQEPGRNGQDFFQLSLFHLCSFLPEPLSRVLDEKNEAVERMYDRFISGSLLFYLIIGLIIFRIKVLRDQNL